MTIVPAITASLKMVSLCLVMVSKEPLTAVANEFCHNL